MHLMALRMSRLGRTTRLWLFVLLAPTAFAYSPVDAARAERQDQTVSALRTLHVALTGSDTNDGSATRPFRTVQRCATIAVAGDTCLIRAGTYRETVRPANSGVEGAPIRFRAAPNETVVVSGAERVSGWTPHRGNIHAATATLPIQDFADTGFTANQVFVAGTMQPQARWPNNTGGNLLKPGLAGGYVRMLDGDPQRAVAQNANIPAIPEGWAGATIWVNEWYTSRTGTVTDGGAGRLEATMSWPYTRDAYWFFVTGKLGLLDAAGEWHYDHAARRLYLWAPGGGEPQDVEVKMRTFAFDLTGRSHIELLDLDVFAATITTSDDSRGVVIDGLRARYVSHHVRLPPLPASERAPNSDAALVLSSHTHDTGIQLRGADHVLRNSEVAFSAGNAVLLEGAGHDVVNNVLRDANYASSFAALIRVNGTGHRILRNTLDGAGRSAIEVDFRTNGVDFRNNEIAYNSITRFGNLSSDLGGIYVCCSVNLAGTTIHHNHVFSPDGYSFHWEVAGIYTDNNSYNATVHHNLLHTFNVNKPNALKIASRANAGPERIYNNTVDAPVVVPSSANYWVRNNLFVRGGAASGAAVSNNLFQGTDPRFINAAARDYSLAAGSPAIDAGVALVPFTDGFSGSRPDIGAFESGVAAWTAGAGSAPLDTRPEAFAFPVQTGTALSSAVTSAAVEIRGLTGAAPVAVLDGAHSIGCTGTFSTAATTINEGQRICVRHTSAARHSVTTTTTLTIGGVSAEFRSTTLASLRPQTANQFDFSGGWFEPATAGQGLMIELYTSSARGGAAPYLFAGWFTYTDRVGGVAEQDWFALEGTGSADGRVFPLTIGRPNANVFDNGAPAGPPVPLGTATLTFSSCTEAVLDYAFNAAAGGRSGQVVLQRLLPNVACDEGAPVANAPRGFLNTGAWFEPATAGQGLLFELNPVNRMLFGAWYTFAASGPADHRWYTLQLGDVDPTATRLAAIPIFETTGGRFDRSETTSIRPVGEATLEFTGCSSGRLLYRFTVGEMAGRSGEIPLTRVGPAPSECR